MQVGKGIESLNTFVRFKRATCLSFAGKVESKASLYVVCMKKAALAIGGITYMMLKPSTEIDEVEEEQGLVNKWEVRSQFSLSFFYHLISYLQGLLECSK